jgi:pimeloyl-ACP methyl ester carboxylesterase
MNRGEAREGAPKLKTFINELRAGHQTSPETPHISVFGHSYGSTVTGLAALAGMKADDVVFYASPGMGKFGSEARDLPQKRIWAAESRSDPINWVNGFLGTNPAASWFGAREIPLSPENRGHSDYILRDTLGAINFAKILTGKKLEDLK